MGRQACAWIVTGALLAGLAAPVFAQGTTQTAPAKPAPAPATPAPAPAAPAAPATKAPAKTDAAKSDAKTAKTKSATGTVKSASAESLTVVGADKKEWTFVVGKETKITKGGKTVEAKDLAEKDQVTVQFTEADGKMTAKSVTVKAAKAAAKKS